MIDTFSFIDLLTDYICGAAAPHQQFRSPAGARRAAPAPGYARATLFSPLSRLVQTLQAVQGLLHDLPNLFGMKVETVPDTFWL